MEELPSDIREDYCIDLGKAARSAHAAYMFPLMRALNDTYFYGRYGWLITQNGEKVPRELVDFIFRNRQAQTSEILRGFVVGIMPKGAGTPKPVFDYIRQKPNVYPLFAQLEDFTKNTEMMRTFKNVRDKLVFHYDLLDSTTNKVVAALGEYADFDPQLKELSTISDAHIMTRHVAGDIFQDVYWHILQGTFDPATHYASRPGRPASGDRVRDEFLEFYSDVTAAFYQFGRVLLLTWLRDFDLIVSHSRGRNDPSFFLRL